MKNFIGIDIACETFVASIYQNETKSIIATSNNFENNKSGFKHFLKWLNQFNCSKDNSIICIENTGCYHQNIAYFLVMQNFKLVIEQPLKIKKASPFVQHKTDSIDSQKIAEYAYRFFDQLHFWTPPAAILEKIKQLLATRELFVKQKIALKNATSSYKYNAIQIDLVKKSYFDTIKNLENKINIIEKELAKYIDQDPDLKQDFKKLKSITGFGSLLSMNLIVLIKSSNYELNHKKLAAFIGICPYKFESGTSVNKRAKIRQFGSNKIKSLLRLAAMSASVNDKKFKEYYLRKQIEGKPKSLALNNIANKMLKVACAILRDNNSNFIKDHYSVNPIYL